MSWENSDNVSASEGHIWLQLTWLSTIVNQLLPPLQVKQSPTRPIARAPSAAYHYKQTQLSFVIRVIDTSSQEAFSSRHNGSKSDHAEARKYG